MKQLLLLTNSYPFNKGEEFLQSEVGYITGFDKAVVCPCALGDEPELTRRLPEGVDCAVLRLEIAAELAKISYPDLLLGGNLARHELKSLLKQGRLNLQVAHEGLFFLKKATALSRALLNAEVCAGADEVVIYTYWLYEATLAGALLAQELRGRGVKVRLVSRAHGFDVFEERSALGYLPMREATLRAVSAVYPCSLACAEHMRGGYPKYENKLHVAYLGTKGCGLGPKPEGFVILSCARVVPVKRLILLARALQLADFPVAWVHLGGGEGLPALQEAAKHLPGTVEARFLGEMTNAEILEFYSKNGASLFVNVSSSEGLPVSIMEACSFGIPALATNVGGTPEIVREGKNGFLLRPEATPEDICNALRKVRELPYDTYAAMRDAAREIWEESFDADKNYRAFYEEIGK